VKRNSLHPPFFWQKIFRLMVNDRLWKLDTAIISDKIKNSPDRFDSIKTIFKSKLNFTLVNVMKRKTNKSNFDENKIIFKS
jgi:hypothetical protein